MKKNGALSPSEKYSETGNMLRHYSSIRAAVVSFTAPIVFAMGALVLSNVDNGPLVVYLLLAEYVLFAIFSYSVMYLSRQIYLLRRCLIQLEFGEEVSPHDSLDKVRIIRDFKMDVFDKLLLTIGAFFHIGFYFYLAIRALI
jgi:hypothetical protein